MAIPAPTSVVAAVSAAIPLQRCNVLTIHAVIRPPSSLARRSPWHVDAFCEGGGCPLSMFPYDRKQPG
jgi:hypothetical protein